MLFIEKLISDPSTFFIQISVVVFSVCCHEYAHARIALQQGDPTAAYSGHLTLNPHKQMGVYSLLMLAFLGIAWGQVPVNTSNLRNKYSEALVAFAGPATNLILFFAFTILLVIAEKSMSADFAVKILVMKFCYLGSILNFALFIINLLPVPILDGWPILLHFFPKLKYSNSEFFKGFTLFICFAVLFGINKIFVFADYLVQTILHAMLY
jgi:Zn-dependent protease